MVFNYNFNSHRILSRSAIIFVLHHIYKPFSFPMSFNKKIDFCSTSSEFFINATSSAYENLSWILWLTKWKGAKIGLLARPSDGGLRHL